MKRYIYILSALAVGITLSSCQEKLGTEPGNDALPYVTVYDYAPEGAMYDSDTDARLRFVSNGKVTEAKYLIEPTATKTAFIEENGEDAYIQKILENGTAINFDDNGMFEVTATDMSGSNDISVAASDGTNKVLCSHNFYGIPWDTENGIEGTYNIRVANAASAAGASSFPAVLQRHAVDETTYRVKGAYGPGSKLTFTLIDLTGEDDGGKYTFFRVPPQELPFEFSTYGPVSVRDIGYWQGDDAWVTQNGYESGIYEDNSCFFYVQYYVSAGNLGYGYDWFIPNS